MNKQSHYHILDSASPSFHKLNEAIPFQNKIKWCEGYQEPIPLKDQVCYNIILILVNLRYVMFTTFSYQILCGRLLLTVTSGKKVILVVDSN